MVHCVIPFVKIRRQKFATVKFASVAHYWRRQELPLSLRCPLLATTEAPVCLSMPQVPTIGDDKSSQCPSVAPFFFNSFSFIPLAALYACVCSGLSLPLNLSSSSSSDAQETTAKRATAHPNMAETTASAMASDNEWQITSICRRHCCSHQEGAYFMSEEFPALPAGAELMSWLAEKH